MDKRVIIFEDDPDMLEICSVVLGKKGFDVKAESTCRNLLEKIADHDPHVILMDNRIPDIGGLAAVKILKKTESVKNIPVILFSAHTNLKELKEEAGADFYLKKPFDIDELEDIVSRAANLT